LQETIRECFVVERVPEVPFGRTFPEPIPNTGWVVKTIDGDSDHRQAATPKWINELVGECGFSSSVDAVDADADGVRTNYPSDSVSQHFK
jgi:hypothetical protein